MRTWLHDQWTRLKQLLDNDLTNELATDERITRLGEALRAAAVADEAWLAWRAQPNETTLADLDGRMRELRSGLDAIRAPAEASDRSRILAGGE
jgi:hypothetical protein